MRTPPNALNVFGTTGATGTARTAPSTALAELNGNRLARGTAPAATRPNAKTLRVESPPMKTSTPQAAANRGRMRRLAGAVWAQEWYELAWFDLAHSSGVDRTIVYRESLPGPPLMSALGLGRFKT